MNASTLTMGLSAFAGCAAALTALWVTMSSARRETTRAKRERGRRRGLARMSVKQAVAALELLHRFDFRTPYSRQQIEVVLGVADRAIEFALAQNCSDEDLIGLAFDISATVRMMRSDIVGHTALQGGAKALGWTSHIDRCVHISDQLGYTNFVAARALQNSAK